MAERQGANGFRVDSAGQVYRLSDAVLAEKTVVLIGIDQFEKRLE